MIFFLRFSLTVFFDFVNFFSLLFVEHKNASLQTLNQVRIKEWLCCQDPLLNLKLTFSPTIDGTGEGKEMFYYYAVGCTFSCHLPAWCWTNPTNCRENGMKIVLTCMRVTLPTYFFSLCLQRNQKSPTVVPCAAFQPSSLLLRPEVSFHPSVSSCSLPVALRPAIDRETFFLISGNDNGEFCGYGLFLQFAVFPSRGRFA